MKNRSSSTAESEKMLKIGFPPRRTSKKQQKFHFRHGWKAENEKNSVSAAVENQKQINSAFQPWRTNEKRWKLAFPHGENQKSAKTGFLSRGKLKISEKYFPKVGKTGKCGKSVFPNLGRTKNGRKWLSQHREDWKTTKIGFPKLGKNKRTQRLRFPPQTFHITAEDLLPARKIDYLKLKWWWRRKISFWQYVLILAVFCLSACDRDLDVRQSYPFTVETMPV